MLQRAQVEFGLGEGVRRRQEGHLGAALAFGLAHLGQRRLGIAVTKAHVIGLAAAPDAQVEPDRQRVDHRHADAMQARSEEHTSELQSLMRISYAVFCLKKKKQQNKTI